MRLLNSILVLLVSAFCLIAALGGVMINLALTPFRVIRFVGSAIGRGVYAITHREKKPRVTKSHLTQQIEALQFQVSEQKKKTEMWKEAAELKVAEAINIATK